MARRTNHLPGGTPPQGRVHFGDAQGPSLRGIFKAILSPAPQKLANQKMIRKPFLSVFDDDSHVHHQAILAALK